MSRLRILPPLAVGANALLLAGCATPSSDEQLPEPAASETASTAPASTCVTDPGAVDDVPNGDVVTLRQLADMTSGVASYTTDKDWGDAYVSDPERVWEHQELIDDGIPCSGPAARMFAGISTALGHEFTPPAKQ